MIKPRKDKVVTESFVSSTVYGAVNQLREEMEGRFESAEKKAEERYGKVMENLDSIAGQFKKFDEERVMGIGSKS